MLITNQDRVFIFWKASATGASATGQPVYAYPIDSTVGPELEKFLNREHTSHVLNASTENCMAAPAIGHGIARLPGDVSIADHIRVYAGLKQRIIRAIPFGFTYDPGIFLQRFEVGVGFSDACARLIVLDAERVLRPHVFHGTVIRCR